MTTPELARPRQASLSGWFILVGSAVVVLFAFQQVSYLRTIEAQEMARDFVSTPPGDGLGLSADDVQSALRVLNMVAAATATAMAILGWQVLRRSTSARLVLSILAPVLLVSGLATSGLFCAVVAAAVAMLWVQPTRAWFAGVAPPPAPAHGRRTTPEAGSGDRAAPPPTDAAVPPAGGSAWGLPPPPSRATMSGMTGMSDVPPPPPGYAPEPPASGALQRPGAVTRACILAIVSSGISLAGLLLGIVYLTTSRDDFLAQIRDELDRTSYGNVTAEDIADVSLGFFVVLAVWAVVAIVLAVVTMRGSNAARITLAVSSIIAAIVSLIGIFAIIPLVITVCAILTAVWLLGRDAKAWTTRRR